GVRLVLQDVAGVDAPLALIIRLKADRPRMPFGVVPFGGAGRDKELRHLVLVHVVPDRAVGRRAGASGNQKDLILLNQLARHFDGLGRRIGVIVGDEIDLAAVDAALGVDHFVIARLTFPDRAVIRGGAAIGGGIADPDLVVGDAGTVLFGGAGWPRC